MSKSILEKALLEAEQLEQTMKSNAKEILSSTMKKEIHELVKESLNEDDYLKEQEEEEVDVLDIENEMDGIEPEMDLDMSDDIELDIEDETDDMVLPELPPLDLTLASDDEVLKVFKAMGDEDGIIIQQDNDEIELTDTTTDAEYIIKLEESKKSKTMKKSIKEMDMDEMDMEEMDGMDEMDMEEMGNMEEGDHEMDEMDEVVYEIELSEDEDEGMDEMEETYDKVTMGGNKGDKSKTHKGKDFNEGEIEEGDYGFKKHKGHSDQGYLDREDDMLGGEHGNEGNDEMSLKTRGRMARGTRKYDMGEASRTLGLGRESGGKHKPSGIRKAITPNRNLGESRLRKSYNLLKEEVDTLKIKNVDYKKALTTFRDKLNEVGVFNSNLAYVTRLFTEHSTTKQEKINILKRFDNIESLKSSKGLYKVIKEELTQDVVKPTKTIAESVERKITKSPTSGGKLLESKVYENPQFSRMKDLMSKM